MRPTAMIVDDHPSFRRFARLLLAAAGYEVVAEASGAAEAVLAAERSSPEFVLLDVLLPDGSGIEVAERIAAEGRMVLLTSSRTLSDLGEKLAGRPFLTKSELSVERLAQLASGF